MKKTWKIIISIILIILIIAISVKIMGNNNNEEDKINEKTKQEIKYLDTQLLSMLNVMNNITFSNYKVIPSEETEGENKNEQMSKSENTSSNTSNTNTSSESEGGNSSEGGSSGGSANSSSNNQTSNTSKSSNTITSTSMVPNTILNGDRDNAKIDWQTLKKDIEIVYSSWNTIVEDLYSLGVNGDDILKFTDLLDKAIMNIKNEDKLSSIKTLADMYNMLPIYILKTEGEDAANINFTKALVINSYALVEEDKWDDIIVQIDGAIDYYERVANNGSNTNNNRTYILLQELKNSVQDKDKDLYYMKYKYCMEELINT